LIIHKNRCDFDGRAVNTVSRSRWFDVALIAGTALLGLTVTAVHALAPRDPLAPFAVIFAPWIGADIALAAAADAGAQVLQGGGFSNIIVVRPDDAGYAARASERGAWLVADAATLRGCGVIR
jgi:hypothetical protein